MKAHASVPLVGSEEELGLDRKACSAPSLVPTKASCGRFWYAVMYVSSALRSPALVPPLVYQYGAWGGVSSAAVELSMPPSTESTGFRPKRSERCQFTRVVAAGELATLRVAWNEGSPTDPRSKFWRTLVSLTVYM